MLFLDGGLGLVFLLLWLFCLIDVIMIPEQRCKHLPKPVWVLIVIFLFDIGSIVWLVAGRDWQSQGSHRGLPYKGNTGRTVAARYPEYERPGRFAATNPDDDEQFLAQVKARAEAQRAAYEQKRAEELQREQDRLHRREED